MKKSKRVLLIGGTGAIGAYLAPVLRKEGYEVHITTRSNHYKNSTNVKYLIGDAHDVDFVKRVLSAEKYETIVDFMDYSSAEFEKHYKIFLNNTKQYMFLSTYRVYAQSKILSEKSPRLLDSSKDSAFLNTDDYALRKARQENILINSGKLNWTILRPGITYSSQKLQFGPMEAEDFIWRALNKLSVPFPKNMLEKVTTMTWAGDAASIIGRLVGNKTAYGEDYIIATNEHHTWREVLNIYAKYLPLKVIEVETEDFIDAMGRGSSEYQVYYDRMYNRIIDNAKVLQATGISQDSLSRLSSAMSMELTRFIEHPKFRYLDIERQMNFNKLIGLDASVGIEKHLSQEAETQAHTKLGERINMRDSIIIVPIIRWIKLSLLSLKRSLRPRTRLKNVKLAYNEDKLFFNLYKKVAYASLSYKKKVFIFGAPYHGNLGDQAQTYCIEQWCRKRYPKHKVISIDTISAFKKEKYILRKIRSIIKPGDKLFLHSGYHTTDLWELENELNLAVLETFPDFHIIVLPQTIHFEDSKKLELTASSYNRHGNVTFMCRDEQSYDIAKKHFSNIRLELMPDIVTTLIGDRKVSQTVSRSRREGVLLCFRNDKESKYGREIENIKKQVSDISPNISQLDTTLDIDPYYFKKHRKQILKNFLKDVKKHKLVITDRYHGTIFSVVSNTPVIVLGSTDHKLSSGVKWFEDRIFADRVYYAESPREAVALAHKIYGSFNFNEKLPSYFSKKYWDHIDLTEGPQDE